MESICGLHQIKKGMHLRRFGLDVFFSLCLCICCLCKENRSSQSSWSANSKYTFPACRELSCYLLINSDMKTKHRTFILFIYLFIGTSGRSSVKQRKNTSKSTKRTIAPKPSGWQDEIDKKTAQISFKNWNCFGFGGMCLLHIAFESMGIDVDTGHAVPKTVKLEMHWICYETNKNFLLHWEIIMVDQSQQSFSPLSSRSFSGFSLLHLVFFVRMRALSLCACVCECDCGTSGILLLKGKGKL